MSKTNTSKKNSIVSKTQKNANFWIEIGVLLLIAAVFCYIYQYCFDEKFSLNGDNASYYLLGKSIRLGDGFTLYNNLNSTPHNHFPPGYPLLISVVMLFGKSPVLIKMLNGLFLFGSLILSYKIIRKLKISWQIALVSVLLMTVNYHLVKSSVIIMSEIPFLFFSLLSLWLLMKIDFFKEFLKSKTFYFFLISLSFTFHIRTAGIAILAGILLYLLFEKRWKGMISVLFGFIILALPWIIRGKILGLKSGYQTQLLKINPYQPELGDIGLVELWTRFSNNVIRYLTKELPSGIFPFLEVNYKTSQIWQEYVLGTFIVMLTLIGIWRLPKYRTLILGYIIGAFSILLLWVDVWKGVRFLLPLIPIIVFLMVYASSLFLEKILGFVNLKSTYLPLLLLPVLLFYTQDFKLNKDQQYQSYPLQRLHLEAKNPYASKWKNYLKIAEYAKKNLKPSDIVACRKPQLFHIFSDRFTCFYPFEEDDKVLIEDLKKRNVKYVVVEQLGYSSTNRYLVPAVNKNKFNFRSVLHLKNPDTYLLKFVPK